MRITVKGQVTIPQDVRNLCGFHPGTEVEFFIGDDGVVRVVQAEQGTQSKIHQAISRLRGSADTTLSTDEIMAMTRE